MRSRLDLFDDVGSEHAAVGKQKLPKTYDPKSAIDRRAQIADLGSKRHDVGPASVANRASSRRLDVQEDAAGRRFREIAI
jgi:hypothetical protein